MRINLDKAIVEFIPESKAEETALQALWIKMGNCVGDNKSLSPIGTYTASVDQAAKFFINGLSDEEAKKNPVVLAPYDTDVYCVTCNKTVHVRKGEPIPTCCGKLMEILD